MKFLGFIGFFLLVTAIGLVFCFPGAWILMLILGALSHLLNVPALAISFWASFWIVVLIWLFVPKRQSK